MYRIWVKNYEIQNFHEPKSVYSVKICRVTACIAHSSRTVGKNVVCFGVVNCVHILTSSRLREMYLLPCDALGSLQHGLFPNGSTVWSCGVTRLVYYFLIYYGMLFVLLGCNYISMNKQLFMSALFSSLLIFWSHTTSKVSLNRNILKFMTYK
jgi:hypothetical protein